MYKIKHNIIYSAGFQERQQKLLWVEVEINKELLVDSQGHVGAHRPGPGGHDSHPIPPSTRAMASEGMQPVLEAGPHPQEVLCVTILFGFNCGQIHIT